MTKREKIIAYLAEHDIDILRFPFIIEKRDYQRSGTVVIHTHCLTQEERCRLNNINYIKREDGWLQYDPSCPIEVHTIRDHFEWQWGLKRIIWKGGAN